MGLLTPALAVAWLLAGWLGRPSRDKSAPPPVDPVKSEPHDIYPGEGIALLGKSLGTYRLDELLGKGSSGTVYRALDLREGQPVAVKVIHQEMLQDFRRVQREIRNWQDFSHPNVVEFRGFGTQDYADGRAHHYMVMELVEGQTLRRKIAPDGLAIDRVRAWIEALSLAVAALHEVGIIHRDIKPENVMIERGGKLKLLDFGLAKRQVAMDALSLQDTYYGTPAYLDPEQLQGQLPYPAGEAPPTNRFDPRMDQYSLGVLVYELLTGRHPLDVNGWSDLMELTPEKHASALQAPSRWRKGLSEAIDSVVLKLLARSPEERYLTMRDAAEALREALADRARQEDIASPQTW